ncbi:MAG: hypothetical protein IT326_02640 [Anaerolineae bacterium]|nr:hypothetical protein [Anaerolineae bacterium]
MGYDLVVIGDLVADMLLPVEKLPIEADVFQQADGLFLELGGSCNTIVAARRVGLSTTVLAAIGKDTYGQEIVRMLGMEGVDVSNIFTYPERLTPASLVISDQAGKHVFLSLFRIEGPQTTTPAHWPTIISEARSVFTNGWSFTELVQVDGLLELMRGARVAGVPVFFDLGPRITILDHDLVKSIFATSDFLFLTLDEAQHLLDYTDPAEMAAALHRFGPAVVVVKVGPEGCYVSSADGVQHIPGYRIHLVDTVGAGDAFAAAFIAGHLRGGTLRDCAALANAMGAATASVRGGGRNVPPVERLLGLLGDDPAARLARG